MPMFIIRGEWQRNPFLANIVKGSATQVTPNGVTYPWGATGTPTGFQVPAERSLDLPAPMTGPGPSGGNRSGE